MRRRLAAGILAAGLAVGAPARAEPPSTTALYLLKCSGCHRADGAGAPEAGVPPFPGFIGALAKDPAGRRYLLHVPGVAASGLSDPDLTRVLNYLLETWDAGSRAQPFTPSEVARLRAASVEDIVSYRRTLVARLRKAGAPIADYPWP